MTARYRYRAADETGRLVEGSIESQSRRSAIEDLRRQSLFPVDVVEADSEVKGRGVRKSLGDSLAAWTRTLATMLSSGISLERSLSFSAAVNSNAPLATAIDEIRAEIHSGSAFSSALKKRPGIFGPLYIAMVTAAEESGALAPVLSRLADNLDEAAELRSKVRAALLYPALMSIVAAMGVTIILLFVIPRFVEMLGDVGGTLPFSTRALVAISGLVTHWWWLWVSAGGLLVWLIRGWVANPSNALIWHRARLGWPLVGELEQSYVTARFTRTFGLLQRSGVGIVASLRIAGSGITNNFIAAELNRIARAVGEGKRLGPELSGVLPPLAVQLLSVGEESGRLDELCLHAADSYDREISRRLRTLISLMEPALIVFFGIVVGFVALAMLQAIYSVNGHVP